MSDLNILREKSAFFSKLYGDKISHPVVILKIDFLHSSVVRLHMLLSEKPNISVGKWGEWGRDYSSVGIELDFIITNRVELRNWIGEDAGDVFSIRDKFFLFYFKSKRSSIKIEARNIFIQKIYRD